MTIENLKRSLPGLQIIESKETTLSGHQAYEITYSSGNALTMLVFTINGDKAYVLAYHTDPADNFISYLPLAKRMINSFNISYNNDIPTEGETGSTNMSEYTNSTFGVAFEYPNSWVLYDSYDNRNSDFLSVANTFPIEEGGNTTNVFVSLDERFQSVGIDPESYVNEFISDLQTTLGNNFSLITVPTNATLAGHPGYILTYLANSAEGVLQVMEIGAVVDNKVYLVDYESSPDKFTSFLPQVLPITDSFALDA